MGTVEIRSPWLPPDIADRFRNTKWPCDVCVVVGNDIIVGGAVVIGVHAMLPDRTIGRMLIELSKFHSGEVTPEKIASRIAAKISQLAA